MSTPTQTHAPQQPSSASKKSANNHATTPSHLGLSPAPRSVPSPATHRKEHAGKTPVNHPTVSSQGSKTLGGSTPMMQTLSQSGFTTAGSPTPGSQMVAGGGGSSHGISSLGTPLAGLGVDLLGGSGGGGIGSAGASHSGTPGLVGGALMAASVSELGRELGLTISGGSGNGAGGGNGGGVAVGGAAVGGGGGGLAMKRNEDEERRAKMRRVLKNIGRPKGRVSEEGIARISRRVGFQNDIDAEQLTAEEKERKVGNRTIVIAGKTIIVDVELRNHVAQNVQVMFDGEGKAGLGGEGTSAGTVLLEDLRVVDGVSLDAKLDRFALNLDWLARTDRLSERVNCFEAVSGLYTSLRRLYELEKEAVKAAMGPEESNRDRRAELETMCKKSGKPSVHENGRIGLSLDYWSVVQSAVDGKHDSDAMETDEDPVNGSPHQNPDLFSLRIEVEASSAALYPAMRISDSWLPETFEVPRPDSAEGIPWQDPPATYLSGDINGDQGDSMVIDETQKLPDLRFVAKLDPPIILPLQTAVSISNALGLTMSQPYPLEHYHNVLLNITSGVVPLGPASLDAEQSVLAIVKGEETEVTHRYALDIPKPDWGYRLEELPFSHPRQLVELLPILRQWAYLGTLIQQAFKDAARLNGIGGLQGDNHASTGLDHVDFANLSVNATPDAEQGRVLHQAPLFELTLSTSPQPAISVALSASTAPEAGNITVQVLTNGEVAVPSRDSTGADGNASELEGPTEKAKITALALAACGDLGVWIEWMRNR